MGEVLRVIYCTQCNRDLTIEGAFLFGNRPFCIQYDSESHNCYVSYVAANPFCWRGGRSGETVDPGNLQRLANDRALRIERDIIL